MRKNNLDLLLSGGREVVYESLLNLGKNIIHTLIFENGFSLGFDNESTVKITFDTFESGSDRGWIST